MVILHFIPAGGWLRFGLYMLPYLLVGYDVLQKAAWGIWQRQLFDENFLMAIATLGAIALALWGSGDYTEAVAVLLFYQVGELFQSVAVGNETLLQGLGIACLPCSQSGTVVHVALDGAYAGQILITDQIKPTAKAALQALQKAGVTQTVLLTGDNAATATQVAKELKLGQVYSDLLPADKVTKLEEILSTSKGKVAFVGDGMNDAPVLSRADVGIAMGAIGSDAAIAADVVLMDDDPAKLAKGIKIARKTMGIVYQNIYFALGIKGLCLLLGALGVANMWLAIFADVGVMVLAILNAMRALVTK